MTAPLSAISNDLELAEFLTDHILDEDLDPQQIAVLLSMAKNRVELSVKPEICIDEDTSKTRSSGDLYTTMKDLPDNFREMLELYVGMTLYSPVPFQKRHTFRNSPLRYYINHKANQFAICGSAGAAETIRQIYLIKTDDFTESSVQDENAATLTWPKEHWPLVAWEAAEIISSGTDVGADDLSFRMSAAHREQHQRALQMFINWDHDLKLKSMDNRTGYADEGEARSLEDDILPFM